MTLFPTHGSTRRALAGLLAALTVACGGGASGSLSGFDPNLPPGAGDVVDATGDTAARPDAAPDLAVDLPDGTPVDAAVDTAPDLPPTACTTDAACDDQVPCTADYCGDDGLCHHGVKAGTCLITGVCVDADTPQWGNACKTCRPALSPVAWSPLDGAPCDDGDPCTAHDLCADGQCVPGAPDECDDGNPCTADACQPGVGCVHEGACACQSDADCKALDDDDLCNGRLRCDKSGALPACAVDPSTVVTCDTSHDTPCRASVCLPSTGACVASAVNEGGACDDDDGCTADDACHQGACAGTPCSARGLSCVDGACTASECGNGSVDPGEACDDANDKNGDGCAKACQVEQGWACDGVPSLCVKGAVLTYGFDSNFESFDGVDGWESQYCDDPWTTDLNGGVFPYTDDGCEVDPAYCDSGYNCGYDWGYWVQYGFCQSSDPLDNHLTWGDPGWADYLFSVTFKNDDDDSLGVVFRYANSGQFYLVYLVRDQAPVEWNGCNQAYTGARLVRIRDQQATLLAESPVTYTVGAQHRLRVVVKGAHLRVDFDLDADGLIEAGEKLFELDDPNGLSTGRVGLWTYENGATGDDFDPCSAGGCWFDDVMVVVP